MKIPCELIVWYVLPSIRRELARILANSLRMDGSTYHTMSSQGIFINGGNELTIIKGWQRKASHLSGVGLLVERLHFPVRHLVRRPRHTGGEALGPEML